MGASDPENKKLTYALKAGPTTGKLAFDAKTGTFTYTPTTAQRILAAVASPQTAKFTATVSDGVAANVKTVEVTLTVSPAPITDKGVINAGALTSDSSVTITNTRAYVTNFDDHTITVVDTVNRQAIGTITLPERPSSVVATLDGKKLYVSDDTTNLVYVYNATAATPTLLKTIDFGASRFPISLATSPDDKTLYATGGLYDAKTDQWNAVVTKISTTTDKITGTVKVPGAYDYFYDLAFTPDGKKIYVIADLLTDDPDAVAPSALYVFSSTSTTAKQIATGAWYIGMTISPDGKRVYVNDVDAGTVSVFDTKTDKVVDTFSTPISTLSGFTVSRDGTVLYAVDTTTNSVVAFETLSGNYDQLATAPVGSTTVDFYPGALLSPDGQELYYVSDQGLQVISLVPANAFPTVTPTLNTPGTTGVVTGAVGGNDTNGDPLKYTTTGGPTKGTLVLNAATGAFTYTPTAAARHAASAMTATTADKTDTFTVTVDDGRRGIVTKTITVNILSANVAPTVKTTVGAPNSSTGVATGTVVGTDKDKDVLTYTGPGGTTLKGGTVTVDAKGKFVYTPTAEARHAAAATGASAADKTDSFTVTVADGHGDPVTVTVSVKIAPANAKPTGAAASGLFTNLNSGKITGVITAVDPDADDFTFTGPASTKKGAITYDSASDTFVYTPTTAARIAASAAKASQSTKTDTFTITLSDGHGGTQSVAVKLTIAPLGHINVGPSNGSASVGQPNSATGAVTGLLTVSDPEHDVMSYTATTPTGGAVTVSAAGTFTFVPTPAARHAAAADTATQADKQDAFTVTANDGYGGTTTFTVIVPISPAIIDATELETLATAGAVAVIQNDDKSVRVINGSFTNTPVRDVAEATHVFNGIAGLLGATSGFAREQNITSQHVDEDTDQGTAFQTFYRLTQTINGIPVIGSEVILVADANGTVTGLYSNYTSKLSDADTTPDVVAGQKSTAEAAATAALLNQLADFTDQNTRDTFVATLLFDSTLAVFSPDPDLAPRLVWQVNVSTPKTQDPDPESDTGSDAQFLSISGQYYVYANGTEAGHLLVQSTGLDGLNALVSSTDSGTDLKGAVRPLNVQRSGNTVILVDTVRNIKVFASTVTYKSQDTYVFDSPPGYPGDYVKKGFFGWDSGAVSAYANVADTFDYYRNTLGKKTFDFADRFGLGNGIRVVVVDDDYKQASFNLNGHTGFIFGDETERAKDAVAHEFTHAVISDIVGRGNNLGLEGSQESLALNEAYADIMGNLIENKTNAGRWTIAEDYRNCSATAGCRDIAHPVRAKYADIKATDDVHDVAGVFTLAAYKMMHDYSATSGISTDKWAKVFYNSLQRLNFGAKFADAGSAVISSAKSQGFSTDQVAAVTDAFRQVGVQTSTGYLAPSTGGSSTTGFGVIGTISSVGSAPAMVATSPDGRRVYIADATNGEVRVVDTATNTVIGSPILVAPYSTAIRVSPDGKKVYVLSRNLAAISVIDTTTNTHTRDISVGGNPWDAALSPDGSQLYVSSPWYQTGGVDKGGFVAVVNTATGAVTSKISFGIHGSPVGLAVSPDGRRLYVADFSTAGTISVVDTTTNKIVGQRISVPSGPGSMAVTPNGSRIYVTSQEGVVSLIDTATNKIVATIALDSKYVQDLVISPDGRYVYVATYTGESATRASVSIIDTTSNRLVGSPTLVGESPSFNSLTTSPDGRYVYVATGGHVKVLKRR
ncbi:hypothetical protein D8S82_28010 [Mycobacterium hodleri]|uniref:Uncharacterized protein n=2 Tax=Mycolicibacterium hodleri TaxID=49897 RepID=A0A544VTG0_9MYCO|nr:hypothetical protein D8S82_28010 [Mycolicibacterium hodleri]